MLQTDSNSGGSVCMSTGRPIAKSHVSREVFATVGLWLCCRQAQVLVAGSAAVQAGLLSKQPHPGWYACWCDLDLAGMHAVAGVIWTLQ